MKVQEMLRWKGSKVVTTHPKETLAGVASLLVENKIGALPVLDANSRLVGVISERDIIRGLAQHGEKVGALGVEDLMTREVVVCTPNDTLKEIMQLMSRNRIRHLPVVEDGALRGIVSLRDVVASQLKEAQLEVNVLRDYARAKT